MGLHMSGLKMSVRLASFAPVIHMRNIVHAYLFLQPVAVIDKLASTSTYADVCIVMVHNYIAHLQSHANRMMRQDLQDSSIRL